MWCGNPFVYGFTERLVMAVLGSVIANSDSVPSTKVQARLLLYQICFQEPWWSRPICFLHSRSELCLHHWLWFGPHVLNHATCPNFRLDYKWQGMWNQRGMWQEVEGMFIPLYFGFSFCLLMPNVLNKSTFYWNNPHFIAHEGGWCAWKQNCRRSCRYIAYS